MDGPSPDRSSDDNQTDRQREELGERISSDRREERARRDAALARDAEVDAKIAASMNEPTDSS
jgi:hypothetical protein